MNIKDYKIVYMGTPEISAYVLEGLIKEGFNIVLVVTKEDKLVGRKAILTPSPCKEVAIKYGIDVFTPKKIRDEYQFIAKYNPDLILTFSYGQIIPEALINMPKYKAINLHGSLLPLLRGAAPVQYALINGFKETGVTLMEMTKEMDAGRMYDKEVVTIDDNDNNSSLFIKIRDASLRLAIRSVPMYLNGDLKGVEQDLNLVTFASMIKPEQEKLSLEMTKEQLHNYIRGLSENPGAYFYLEGKKFKIYKSRIFSDEIIGEIGQIVRANKTGLLLQTSNGLLALDDIQLEGKKRMDYKSFINGFKDIENKHLN